MGRLGVSMIEELPELRSIVAVQNLVAKISHDPVPRRLNENNAYAQWVQTHRSSQSLTGQMDKTAFDAFVKDVRVYLQTIEEEAWQECGKIGPMEEEELGGHKADEFVEAVKLKMARHMCTQTAMSFELLDKDKDGVQCFVCRLASVAGLYLYGGCVTCCGQERFTLTRSRNCCKLLRTVTERNG